MYHRGLERLRYALWNRERTDFSNTCRTEYKVQTVVCLHETFRRLILFLLLRPRRRETGRGRSNLGEMQERIKLALELREVTGISVWAANQRRSLVDGCEACSADLELGELVIRNLHRIARVSITRGDTLSCLLKGKSTIVCQARMRT